MGKAKARAMEVPECWSHGLDSSGFDRVGQPELEILQAACSNSTRAAQTSALAAGGGGTEMPKPGCKGIGGFQGWRAHQCCNDGTGQARLGWIAPAETSTNGLDSTRQSYARTH